MIRALLLLLMTALPHVAIADDARPLAENPQAEARLKRLAAELRCLVCQNQTLADSNAPLAEDLRREVRDMIENNLSDQDILDFLVARYGDFVLYRPPLKATTVLLWVGPFVLLAVGATALILTVKRRARTPPAVALSDEDRHRVEHLLTGKVGRP